MKTRQFFFCGGLLLAGLLASPDARAQMSTDLIMETYNSNISAITNGAINKSVLEKSIARNNAARSGTSRTASPGTAATRTAATANTAYTPTPALRQQTVQNYVDRLKASNPAGAQAVASAFGPGKYDYSQTYREILKGTGLRENDATDALAAYMLLGWAVVHNVQDGKAITVPMAQGVRAQIAPLLADNAQARGRAAQLGEEMKLQTVIVQGGWQSAIREGKLAAYQQGINTMFKRQYGMDLSQFKLTNKGFAGK
jgi:stage V sporulation protein SpoVS